MVRIEDLSKELPKSLEFGEIHSIIEGVNDYIKEDIEVDWSHISLNMQFYRKLHPTIWEQVYDKIKQFEHLESTSVVRFDKDVDTNVDFETVTKGLKYLHKEEYRVAGVRKWDISLYEDGNTLVVIINDLKRPQIGLTVLRVENMIQDVRSYVSEDKVALSLKKQPMGKEFANYMKLCNVAEIFIYLQSLLYDEVFKLGEVL